MRYIFIFLTLFATGCSGQNNDDRHNKIDTVKFLNPNNHPGNAGTKDVNMFKRSISLMHPDFYATLNDKEYKFENLKKLRDFVKINKYEIQKDLFYILTDSNTSFKKIVSTIGALTENEIKDYKVINIQKYFTPPEPRTIQAPTPVETITKVNESPYFFIEVLDNGINVKLKEQETKLKNTDDLDLFLASHKPDIKEILITIEKQLPDSKFKAVLEVLKKHEFKKFSLASK